MPKETSTPGGDERWAQLRFSVVGPLLAAPPQRGELKEELQRLAQKEWRHPISGQWVQFGASTIERWYYKALNAAQDPLGALARKIREDCGTHPSLSPALCAKLFGQYREHPSWSYQLHADNLAALVGQEPELAPAPSYPSVLRYMKGHGLLKRPRRGRGRTAGERAAEKRFEQLEIRSYESQYANALWHLDFHSSPLRVLLNDGTWSYPHLLGVLDDHSRLCVHAQWYLAETAENLIHGLCQGIEKHGLPRALMTDNGSAMTAGETVQGLERLSVFHETTLPHSPYQNGKQEVFWAQVDGRLMAMLEGCTDLSLAQLNEATLAWAEFDYNRKEHSELGQPPLNRFVEAKDVGRPCPPSDQLRVSFTARLTRAQRRSDGTLTVQGVRFEVPSRYRHLSPLSVRVASWDLSYVHLANPRSGQVLCRLYPLDKQANADGRRRGKQAIGELQQAPDPQDTGMAPLLRQFIAQYTATGLPPAYLPKDETTHDQKETHP
jgi:transposase InsO family protein